MKIHCSRNEPKINDSKSMYDYLKSVEGKEVWIKIGLYIDYNLFYIRVVGFELNNKMVVCNRIMSLLLDDPEDNPAIQEDIDRLNSCEIFYVTDIEVPENNAFDAYTTSEVLEILEGNLML